MTLFFSVVRAQVSYSVYDVSAAVPGETFGYADGINNSGQVDGYVGTSGGDEAFVASVSSSGVVTATVIPPSAGSSNTIGGPINNSGQVAGSEITSGYWGAYLANTSTGSTYNLGALGGTYSQPNAINSSGQVAGSATVASGQNHAFLASVSSSGVVTMTNLGTLSGGIGSFGNGLNNAGQVVGASLTSSSTVYHAFVASVSSGGAVTMIDLGTLSSASSAQSWGNAINNAGQATGYTDTNAGNRDAFLATVGSGGAVTMVDLGNLGGGYSTGVAINDSGVVTGYSSVSGGYYHAFIATVGSGGAVTMTDLGTLGDAQSEAITINSVGDVLGRDETSSGTGADYFLYDASYTNTTLGNHLLDLTTLLSADGWSNANVIGLNDSDQLTGYGLYGGVEQTFLMNLNVTAVPEPSAYAAWAIGLVLLFRFISRRLRPLARTA